MKVLLITDGSGHNIYQKYWYRYSQGSVQIHSDRRNAGQPRKSGEITIYKDRPSWYSLAADELWQHEVKLVPVLA